MAKTAGLGIINLYHFDAPRELVFFIYTDPEMIPVWWGPRRFTTRVVQMDLQPGGTWRFIQQDQDGKEYAFHGIYREITPPERLVFTFEYEGMPGHNLVETLTFEEQDTKTRLTDKMLFQSFEDRDEMFNSGMEEGAAETMERFSEIIKKTISLGR